MSPPVLPREASKVQVLPPPNPPPAPPEPARPVKSGAYLGHPQQPLSLVAKKEAERYQRYRQWLDHELARLPPYKADGIRKAIAEIREAQGCTAPEAAFNEWLSQPGHEKLKAVYDDYLNPIAVAVELGPAPLDPVEAWLFDGHLNAKSIVAVLQDPSTLGDKLQNDDDKRYLLDRALTNFSHLAFDKIEELAVLVRDDPKIDPRVRRVVAEQLLQRAVDPGDDAENPRAQARAYALDFWRAMRNDPRGMADQWDPKNPPVERLEALLTSTSGASLLCTGSSYWKAAVRDALRLNPDLTVAKLGGPDGDARRNPEVAYAVAVRLVVELHGGTGRAATPEENGEAEPVARALQTWSGHKLLFDPDVSADDRKTAPQIVLADGGKKLTRDVFEHAGDAWQIPAISEAFAVKKLAGAEAGDVSSLSEIGKKT